MTVTATVGAGGPAGEGDESDSEDSHILDPPGDAGGVPAIHGQPGNLLAQLPGYRGVRVRLFLGGLPLAGLLGQAALGDPALPRAPLPACEHCHTIPYQKGVCCSNVGVRTECPKCLAMVWPREREACCGGGKRVLGNSFNPPLRPQYRALLQSPHVSFNSRILNSALALGSQGTFPSREHGGLGMYDEGLAFLHLMGKAYLVLRTPQEGCNPFDSHMLPKEVLFDGAAKDFGEDYAGQLVAFRDFLQDFHPLAKRLSLARDMPGERIDLNNVVRLEAHAEQSGAMELAFLDSGVPRPAGASNRVVYLDMKRKERGERPNVTVSTNNALYEVLQFPLLFEEGKGGYFQAKEGGVMSTTGAPGAPGGPAPGQAVQAPGRLTLEDQVHHVRGGVPEAG